MIKFTVYAEPKAKGRPRFARKKNFVMAYTDKKTKDAEKEFIDKSEKFKPVHPIEGAVAVKLTFIKEKPKAYPKKVKYWTKKPDIENLAKLVLDAMNEIFWVDDSQIVAISTFKLYGSPNQIKVEIEEIKEK